MTAKLQPFATSPDYWNGNADAAAVALGFGTSSARFQMGADANQNGVGLFFETTALSGDSRGINLRLYFSGAGVSGEALRAYGIVNNVTAATGGTVNGAHISLGITGASGAVSGAGNALRATLSLGASANPGGTLSGIQLDSDFDNAATVPAGVAGIRITDTNTKKWAYFLRTPNVASAGLLAAHITDALSHSIRCITEGGTVFYVMCTTDASNRTGGA